PVVSLLSLHDALPIFVTPRKRCNSRLNTSSSGPSDGLTAANTCRAVSGAGTSCRRNGLGNDLISAVTSSSRRPGTCHSKPSPLRSEEHTSELQSRENL